MNKYRIIVTTIDEASRQMFYQESRLIELPTDTDASEVSRNLIDCLSWRIPQQIDRSKYREEAKEQRRKELEAASSAESSESNGGESDAAHI